MTRERMNRQGFLAALGPGLVWAAAAIGVSHLVQSTRAGATYGFALVGVVVLANLLKYPFFEFGPRYAAATGESLVDGYRRQGLWAVWVYLVLTLLTMCTVVGAVTFVTGALATQVFGPLLGPELGPAVTPLHYSAAMLALSALLLIPGRYPLLDKLVKGIIVVLTLSTVTAVVLALLETGNAEPAAAAASPDDGLWTLAGFSFLIALVGWMPSAVDISVWHSTWTLARAEETRHKPRLREALFDFNLGYIGTAVLALLFLTLGALVIHGRGAAMPEGAGAFALQLVDLYTETLGSWARPLIVVAAFTTMFSTTLTCTDAFPRVLRRTTEILAPRLSPPPPTSGRPSDRLYWIWMVVVVAGSLVLISLFQASLTAMVDLATTLSFLTSPVLGWLNFRAVTSPHMPEGTTPPPWLRALTWAGLAFGVVFGVVFLLWRFVWT